MPAAVSMSKQKNILAYAHNIQIADNTDKIFKSVFRNVIVLNVLNLLTAAFFAAFCLAAFFSKIESDLVIIYSVSVFFLNMFQFLPFIASGNYYKYLQ